MNYLAKRAAISALVLTFILVPSTIFAQGSLTPPGAPAPGMKTLTQIEPRTPISSLPFVINSPGSYYVTTNLTGVSGNNGIIISCGNVTLDLGGFTLQGVPGSASGIYVGGSYTNLVIRNGTLTVWGLRGLDAYSTAYPRNMLFENLTLSANGLQGLVTEAGSVVRDCLAYGNTNDGISSVGGEVTHCVSRNNGGYGFSASVIEVGSGCTLRQCLAEYNAAGGFTLTNSQALNCNSQTNTGIGFTLGSSQALDCNSQLNSSNGFTCYGNGNEIHRCRVANNNGDGIDCGTGAKGTIIADCEIANNNGYGIYTYSGGAGGADIVQNNINLNNGIAVRLDDANNRIDGNHVVTGGFFGLDVVGTNNVVVRNVVMGAGAANFGVNPGNDIGPIGSASSSTSPWANISR